MQSTSHGLGIEAFNDDSGITSKTWGIVLLDASVFEPPASLVDLVSPERKRHLRLCAD